MKIKFTGWIHLYYFIVLSLIAGLILYGSRHLLLNGDKMHAFYEATVRFDRLEQEAQFAEAKNVVHFARTEDAAKIVGLLRQEARFLDSVVPLPIYGKLDSDLKGLEKILKELPSSDKIASLKREFYQKVFRLETLAAENGWGQLERVSGRLRAKIQGAEFLGLNNVSRLVKSIAGDLESIAREIEKKPVLKTVNLSGESRRLNGYIAGLKGVNTALETTGKSYQIWKEKLSPEISLKKINLTKNSKDVFWGTIILLGMIGLAAGGGLLLGKVLEKLIGKKFEIFTTKIIQDGLFPAEKKIDIKLSKSFEEHFDSLREYFHKRLGFGAMIQEGIPFPVLLLDSNLNLLWANDLFYEKWNLDNNEISLSWDYLAQFTDLKGEDPVLAALKGEVAGIYNINILANTSYRAKGDPVEMYVRPVGYGKKKRVMLIFYSLDFLEETLADKTKDIVEPVVKTLNTLERDEYTPDFERSIAEDFSKAGIGDVFENFHSHHHFLKERKSALDAETAKMEIILNEQYKLSSEFKMLLKSDEDVLSQSLHEFSRFKNSLINIIGMREQMEESYRQSVKAAQGLLTQNDQVLASSEKMLENINTNKAIFLSLVDIGKRLKESKGGEESARMVQQLNIMLSKALMLMEDEETLTLGSSIRQAREAGDFVQQGMENLDKMAEEFQRADDMLINCLKEFYSSFRELQNNTAQMGHFVGMLDNLNKNYTPTDTV